METPEEGWSNTYVYEHCANALTVSLHIRICTQTLHTVMIWLVSTSSPLFSNLRVNLPSSSLFLPVRVDTIRATTACTV